MHDLDRTLQTLEPEAEYEGFELGEYELSPEIFGPGSSAHGANGGYTAQNAEGELSPEAELELASELFSASNEGELEQFYRRFSRYHPRLRRRGHYRMRRFFRRYLYGYGGGYGLPDQPPPAAIPAPPFPAPAIPVQAMPAVPAVVEAEPVDAPDGGEELEFECARRFVRLGRTLAQKYSDGPEASGVPAAPPAPAPASGTLPRTGRWERRNGRLLVLGA
ncbi:MAG TPA: hypothetical protein VMM92_13370 [Thermoanaerobaculia bacterium]|nr:hypothetical protein [Thermoanaerobaculia bacterium]